MGDFIQNRFPFGGEDFQRLGRVAKRTPRQENAEAVGAAQEGLRIGVLVVAAGPDHEHALLTGGGFALVDDGQTGGNVVAVEDARGEYDDSLNEVIPQEAGADEVFVIGLFVSPIFLLGELRLTRKQDALRHHHNSLTSRLERFRDVLHPGVVAIVPRRPAVAEAVKGIAICEAVRTPVLERKREIHDHAVELLELAIAGLVLRITQAVAMLRLPRVDPVKDHVDARDIVSGEVAFLGEEEEPVRVFLVTAQVFPALEQKGRGATGPVADLVLLFRLDNLRHEVRNFSRRVELARAFARFAGKRADQILVSVAKEVIWHMGAVKLATDKMIHELYQLVARQFIGLIEINLAGENAVELRRISPLDGKHGVVERLAELEGSHFLFSHSNRDRLPHRVRRHYERQRLFLHRRIVGQIVAEGLRKSSDRLLEDVADAFEKEQRKNVAPKLRVINVATQDVGSLFKECIQLCLCHAAQWDGNDRCSIHGL